MELATIKKPEAFLRTAFHLIQPNINDGVQLGVSMTAQRGDALKRFKDIFQTCHNLTLPGSHVFRPLEARERASTRRMCLNEFTTKSQIFNGGSCERLTVGAAEFYSLPPMSLQNGKKVRLRHEIEDGSPFRLEAEVAFRFETLEAVQQETVGCEDDRYDSRQISIKGLSSESLQDFLERNVKTPQKIAERLASRFFVLDRKLLKNGFTLTADRSQYDLKFDSKGRSRLRHGKGGLSVPSAPVLEGASELSIQSCAVCETPLGQRPVVTIGWAGADFAVAFYCSSLRAVNLSLIAGLFEHALDEIKGRLAAFDDLSPGDRLVEMGNDCIRRWEVGPISC